MNCLNFMIWFIGIRGIARGSLVHQNEYGLWDKTGLNTYSRFSIISCITLACSLTSVGSMCSIHKKGKMTAKFKDVAKFF